MYPDEKTTEDLILEGFVRLMKQPCLPKKLEPGHDVNTYIISEKVMKRDRKECRMCGSKENLIIHYVQSPDGFETIEEANDLSNLVTVCEGCHESMEGN